MAEDGTEIMQESEQGTENMKKSEQENQISVGDNDLNIEWLTLKKKWNTHPQTKDRPLNFKPNMVFSIIGDSDSFVPKPWPQSKFQSALIAAAKNAGDSLILYQGRKTGISRVVYEAFKTRYILDFYNNEAMPNKEDKITSSPLIQLLGIQEKKDNGSTESNENSNMEQKDKFEDSVYKMIYTDKDYIKFMVTLEEKISRNKTTFTEVNLDFDKIPLIIVLLEGDDNSIQHVKNAIKKDLPVVIVKGTGKAANLIADCIEGDDIDMKLRSRAPLLFGTSFKEEKLKDLIDCMEAIKNRRWLINVFNLNTDDPDLLSQIAGEAVICGWSMENIAENSDYLRGTDLFTRKSNERDPAPFSKPENIQKNSQMSNRSDQLPVNEQKKVGLTVTEAVSEKSGDRNKNKGEKRYVLISKCLSPASLPLYFYLQYQTLQEEKKQKDDREYQELLLEALKANRTDYIQVLLNNGVVIREEREKHLGDLYSVTVKCESCVFTRKSLHWIMIQQNSNLTKDLFGDIAVSESAKELCREMLGYYKVAQSKVQNKEDEQHMSVEQGFLEDLLLWSIFANRPRIAEIIWQKIDNQLLAGICCAVLLKHLSEEASDTKENQLSNALANHSEAFQKRCLLLMDKLYDFDPNATTKIVKDLSTIWGITSSPMQFAYENELYDIVAHIGCEKAVNRKWYKKWTPDCIALLKSFCDPKSIQSPMMRYVINYIMFLTMLVSYSSYVMTSIDDNNYQRIIARISEYYTYFWAFGDLIEEVKRLSWGIYNSKGNKSHRRWNMRLWHYFQDFWNLIDILSYILLITALFVRHFCQSENYNIARRLFSFSLLVMYLRFLQIFFISHRLGTQLLMIKKMLKDLVDFLYVMIIIIVGVGIYYHANLFPNHLAWSFWRVFYYPYWQIYGETFNEYLEGKDLSDCISNMTIYELDPSQERCPREEWSVQVVSAFYFLLSNLLLVNLVIAKFSYTFDEVQSNSVKLWKYQLYTIVTEYKSRIPSPFNILFYLSPFYWILKYCSAQSCCKSDKAKEIEPEMKKRKRKRRMEIQKVFAGRCIDIES